MRPLVARRPSVSTFCRKHVRVWLGQEHRACGLCSVLVQGLCHPDSAEERLGGLCQLVQRELTGSKFRETRFDPGSSTHCHCDLR